MVTCCNRPRVDTAEVTEPWLRMRGLRTGSVRPDVVELISFTTASYTMTTLLDLPDEL